MPSFTQMMNIAASNLEPFHARVVVTSNGIFPAHINYLIKHRKKSQSWLSKSSSSIVKLLDFAEAHQGVYRNPRVMFEAFAEILPDGTIDENGHDPRELYWEPISAEHANSIIEHITNFSDFVYKQTGDEKLLLNPPVEASKSERLMSLAAYHHKKNNSFLSHTWNDQEANEKARTSRLIKRHKTSQVQRETKVTEEFVANDLICNGFWRYKHKRHHASFLNVKNILISMLIHYAGLRISEPFHIFISDISDDPVDKDRINIKIQDPEIGKAPKYWRKKPENKHDNIKTYLKKKYGLKPRTKLKGNQFAGYKSKGMEIQVELFPTFYWQWFTELLNFYITHQRKTDPLYPHPYLFTDEKGHPATIKQYRKAREKALIKLGHEPSKYSGNNPHGGRHRYGTELTRADISQILISRAMHHKSLTSKDRYTEEEQKRKVAEALLEAEKRRNEGGDNHHVNTDDFINEFNYMNEVFKSN